jgi:hypothetical protein
MKFQRDESFDARFDKIKDIRSYPYVGKRFGENGARIMVYAHNIPIDTKRYDKMRDIDYKPKDTWASCLEEYIYPEKCPGFRRRYTNTFRCFIKGTVGLKANYGEDSEPSIIQRVDAFVERIAYLNFIQDLVKSDKALAPDEPEQIELSKKVNHEILKFLNITHCICWGRSTYEYVCSITGFNKVLPEKYEGKSGFSSCVIDVGGGKMMQCLRIHHPSMPGFGPFSDTTHSIISRFLETKEGANGSNYSQPKTTTASIADSKPPASPA